MSLIVMHFLLLQIIAIFMIETVYSFGIQIPAGGMENCFFREVHSSSRVSFHYTARETINITLKDPNGAVIHEKRSVLKGQFTFDASKDGSYQVCLSTGPMRRMPTITKFRFLVFDANMLDADVAQLSQVHHIRKLCKLVVKTSEKVRSASQLLSDSASKTNESLRKSISLAATCITLECIVALIVALTQHSHVRNLLSASRAKRLRMV